jgi:hypothetical protein
VKILILTHQLPYPANTPRKIRTYNYIKDMIPGNRVTVLSRYDRSYDNTEASDHFTQMGCHPVFCNEPVVKTAWGKVVQDLLASLFSPYPYSVNSCISQRMLARFLKVYEQGKFDKIVCDGIHQTIHVPQKLFCYKILLEHAVSSPEARTVLAGKNPAAKLFTLLEWKKFKKLEDLMWRHYDEIHVYAADEKKQIEARTGHKNVRVIACA